MGGKRTVYQVFSPEDKPTSRNLDFDISSFR